MLITHVTNSSDFVLMWLLLVWPAAPASDESALEVAWPPAWRLAFGVHDDVLYKSTAFTFTFYLVEWELLLSSNSSHSTGNKDR